MEACLSVLSCTASFSFPATVTNEFHQLMVSVVAGFHRLLSDILAVFGLMFQSSHDVIHINVV